MTANKMPVMPEAEWNRLSALAGLLDGIASGCAEPDYRPVITANELKEWAATIRECLSPMRDYNRAGYLAGLEAARQAVPSYTRCEMTDHYNVGRNRGLSDTLTALTALEQEAKK